MWPAREELDAVFLFFLGLLAALALALALVIIGAVVVLWKVL